MTRLRHALIAAAVAAACTAPAPTLSPSARAETPKIVATTTIIADLARNVTGARVDSLAPAGVSVEDFEPKPEDARKVAEARVILVNGLSLDRWSAKVLKNAGKDAKIVVLSEGLPRLGIGQSADEDVNKNGNPHYWFDVKYAKTYVERIRDAVTAADPGGRDEYAQRTAAYLAQLDALDRDIRAQIATIPAERRKLVTSHDAFPYFAAAYGMRIVGFAEPEAGKEPTAAELAALVEKVKAEHVPAIFSESQVSPALAQALARDAGVRKVVAELITDSVGPAPADSYIGLMRYDVDLIVATLR